MLYELLKLLIPYVILIIGCGIMKIPETLASVWARNILTKLIGLLVAYLGMLIFIYSFIRIGVESMAYMQNLVNESVSRANLIMDIRTKAFVHIIIFTIIGVISYKISEKYEQNGKVYIQSIAIRCSLLSLIAVIEMILSSVVIILFTE